MKEQREIIVAGARASGALHIGNYLGFIQQAVEIQNDPTKNCFFFIADLHALTTPFEPKDLRKNELEIVCEYLAAGIDPHRCTFFLQNHVPEHSELTWIFNCILPLGELERMTQFKDKSGLQQVRADFELANKYFDQILKTEGVHHAMEKQKELMKIFGKMLSTRAETNAGLLTYPSLMAADILVYKAQGVPVGEDQVQHVELSRIVARKFNARFGKTFPEPKTYERKPLRIMSLKDPHKKMSKTGDEALLLSDSPEEMLRKFKKAVTATDASNQSAGVDNLFFLLSHFGTKEQITYFVDAQKSNTIKYSELKEILATQVSDHFKDFRDKKTMFMKRPEQVAQILSDGAKKARSVASETMREVKEKIGLL